MIKTAAIINLLVLLYGVARAQSAVEGKLRDEEGNVVAWATVKLWPTQRITASDQKGVFSFKEVANGDYELRISAVGFKTLNRPFTVNNAAVKLTDLKISISTSLLDQVVVTASRLEQTLGDVPIPISIIGREQIARSSNLRLDEVLREQTGLNISSDHGTGIQVQGMDSEYVLILVDGEPLIGRTAGTLDLSRITVNNIERIEVVKGPSSSLYGSEAMGGVINIITKNPDQGLDIALGARYRRFNNMDLNATLSYGKEKFNISAFINRLSSDGYDLNKKTLRQTVAPFTATTLQVKSGYDLTNNLKLSVSGRYYQEPQEDRAESSGNGPNAKKILLNYHALRTDWNILPKLEWRVGEKGLITLRHYMSQYETERRINRASDNSLFSPLSRFKQKFNRTEGQADFFINPVHTLTFGAGYIDEGVNSTRYTDSTFVSKYVFAQHLWQPTERLDVTLGARYDKHDAYGDNFSPKLGIGYQLSEKLKIRASFGVGFKAPDFRQLLLDFTNPTAGYSVMGTTVVVSGIERLIARGETFKTDPVNNPNALESARANARAASGSLKAERSLAYNLGANYQLNDKVLISANLFRNNISNLIDTWAIAQKDNDQFVFSYRNVENIVTQGVEFESSIKLKSNLNLSAGYQFLDTFDQDVIKQIKKGTLAYRPPGQIVSRQVKRSDYGGLFGRSRHSGNVKINYAYNPLKLNVFFRSIYRGHWGFGDRDGNKVLIGDQEYADGYFLHNISLQKTFGRHWTIDLGLNNILGTTHKYEPALPGKIWFAGVRFQINKQKL